MLVSSYSLLFKYCMLSASSLAGIQMYKAMNVFMKYKNVYAMNVFMNLGTKYGKTRGILRILALR